MSTMRNIFSKGKVTVNLDKETYQHFQSLSSKAGLSVPVYIKMMCQTLKGLSQNPQQTLKIV